MTKKETNSFCNFILSQLTRSPESSDVQSSRMFSSFTAYLVIHFAFIKGFNGKSGVKINHALFDIEVYHKVGFLSRQDEPNPGL